jgi:hypothetical protein
MWKENVFSVFSVDFKSCRSCTGDIRSYSRQFAFPPLRPQHLMLCIVNSFRQCYTMVTMAFYSRKQSSSSLARKTN